MRSGRHGEHISTASDPGPGTADEQLDGTSATTTECPPEENLAVVVYDSRLDRDIVSATRSSAPALMLVMRTPDLAVELGCVGSSLVGQVIPPNPACVELLGSDRRGRVEAATTDGAGGFVFDVVKGLFRLRARTADGVALSTGWLSTAP